MKQYIVTGMTCAACQAHVEKAVGELKDVDSVSVSLLTNSMRVEGNADPGEVIQAVEKAGYGEYFNHRLGHGIGMDVHEFPSIMEGNDLVIEEGMCFSVEPGIYIPEKVGVRIEDCGYVTKDGFEVFTHTPKELLYFDV